MSCSYYTLVHHACLWKISKPNVPCSPIHLHSQLSSNLHYYYYILPGLQLLFLRLFFQCLFPLISWSLKKQNNCRALFFPVSLTKQTECAIKSQIKNSMFHSFSMHIFSFWEKFPHTMLKVTERIEGHEQQQHTCTELRSNVEGKCG